MSSKDPFGDRIKGYEALTETVIPKDQGLVVRVDGRAFHTFTRPLHKFSAEDGLDGWPNVRFLACMEAAARAVAEDLRPDIFYYQSDEVTFAWFPRTSESEFPFGGRVQKLASLCASKMSVAFYEVIKLMLPKLFERENQYPIFDGRCFGVPDATEVANAVLWRMFDADKNAIQTIARKRFGKGDVLGIPNKDLRVRLFLLDSNAIKNDESLDWVNQNGVWFISGVGQLFFRGGHRLGPCASSDIFNRAGLDTKAYWKSVTSEFPEHFPQEEMNEQTGSI